jgi:hypothetical protein
MGYQVPRKTARLSFEGEEYQGLAIEAAMDLTFEAQEHFEKLQRAEGEDKGNQAIDFFVENCITSWNLEDEKGEPRPLTGAALRKEPTWFAVLVMNTYTAAVRKLSEVDAPLDEKSPNGSTSMEAPTAVPENSPTPAL